MRSLLIALLAVGCSSGAKKPQPVVKTDVPVACAACTCDTTAPDTGWRANAEQARSALAQAKLSCDRAEFRAGADECFGKGGVAVSLCGKDSKGDGDASCCKIALASADISGRKLLTIANPATTEQAVDVFEVKGAGVEPLCTDLVPSKAYLCTGEDAKGAHGTCLDKAWPQLSAPARNFVCWSKTDKSEAEATQVVAHEDITLDGQAVAVRPIAPRALYGLPDSPIAMPDVKELFVDRKIATAFTAYRAAAPGKRDKLRTAAIAALAKAKRGPAADLAYGMLLVERNGAGDRAAAEAAYLHCATAYKGTPREAGCLYLAALASRTALETHARAGLAANPDATLAPLLHLALGADLLRTGRLDEAEPEFAAIKDGPAHAAALNGLVWVYLATNRCEDVAKAMGKLRPLVKEGRSIDDLVRVEAICVAHAVSDPDAMAKDDPAVKELPKADTDAARQFFAGPAHGKERVLWMVKTCTEMLGSWRPALPMTLKLEGDVHELAIADRTKGFHEALETCLSDLGGPPIDATVRGSVKIHK